MSNTDIKKIKETLKRQDITVVVDDVTYKVVGDVVSVQSCPTSAEGRLVIPEYILENPITSIGDNAFNGCTGLTYVTIPDSVTSISSSAFTDSGLKYLGVTVYSPLLAADADGDGTVDVTIGFAQTIGGKDVYVYDSSKTLFIDTSGNEYLIDINGITSSDYPDGITVNNLKSVVLGTNVLTIGDNAFEGCTSLTEIIIPDSVYTIIDFAFQGAAQV